MVGRLARQDLDRVFRRGHRRYSDFFQVAVLSSGTKKMGLAVIAGKAVDKRATVRNRLRRRVREYAYAHQELIPPSCAVAITLTRRAAGLGRRDFYAALHDILIRIS